MKNYQHFTFLVFFTAVCMYSTIDASDRTKNKKSVISMKNAVAAWLIIVPIINGVATYHQYSSRPCGMDKYPNAQNWYNEMSDKYPQANLKSAEFCENRLSHTSLGNRILFPTTDLQAINTLYGKQKNIQTLPEQKICSSSLNATDVDTTILAKNEFILLHEAGHKNNYDSSMASLAFRVAISTGAIVIGSMTENPYLGLPAAVGFNVVFEGVSRSIKENRADAFARKHAEKNALLGELRYLNNFTDYYNRHAAVIDPCHKTPRQRADLVIKELKNRNMVDSQC